MADTNYMTSTRTELLALTADQRLAWEDARIAAHQAAGADFDEALGLVATEWAEITGEDLD
jgi:hypothetical protein